MASARERLSSVIGHLNPVSSAYGGKAKLLAKNPDDIVGKHPKRESFIDADRSSRLLLEHRSQKRRKGGLKIQGLMI